LPSREKGALDYGQLMDGRDRVGQVTKGTVIVSGPGNLSWNYPVIVTADSLDSRLKPVASAGTFYKKFHEKDLPTGVYSATFEDERGHRWGSVSWRME